MWDWLRKLGGGKDPAQEVLAELAREAAAPKPPPTTLGARFRGLPVVDQRINKAGHDAQRDEQGQCGTNQGFHGGLLMGDLARRGKTIQTITILEKIFHFEQKGK